MGLYIPGSTRQARALAKAAHLGRVRRLARGVYSDDLERPAANIVREHIMAIAATRYPDSYVSHSSAAVRGLVEDTLFLSGGINRYTTYHLPGVSLAWAPSLPHPEIDEFAAPTSVSPALSADPEYPKVRVSSPLQTIFECMMPTRRHPHRRLPDAVLTDLISRLGQRDRDRARAFAERNSLEREYKRFHALGGGGGQAQVLPAPPQFALYFYGWQVGRLTVLGQGEIRFEYAAAWPFSLSHDLPLRASGPSYEGPRLPTFFDNLLPEGWTEDVIAASYKIAKEDRVRLLETTRKYLSNLTLRPLPIPDSELVYDAHRVRLAQLTADTAAVLHLNERVGFAPEARELWEALRQVGAVRLSGVQPKLPVALEALEEGPVLDVGDLRHSCTHILKLPVPSFPNLVENEWACLELGRRAGLRVPDARVVTFPLKSQLPQPALLVERYDIPTHAELEGGGPSLMLPLQQDAAMLLGLERGQKYEPSLESITRALLDLPLAHPSGHDELLEYLKHVAFSWIVGNGDLHAKNISVLRLMHAGRPGESPTLRATAYAPAYDLVNTRLVIPGDLFALTVNGRKNNLRWRDFVSLSERWGGTASKVREIIEELVAAVQSNLDEVLAESRLPQEATERFKRIVGENVRSLRL